MNKKTKICYIIPRFYPFKGGAEQNIQAMAERLAKTGHDVTVYTTNVRFRNEKLKNYEEYKGIKIHRHWALNQKLYAGFYPKLLPKLLKNEFDVIHVSGFGFIWAEFCLLLKKIKDPSTKFINTPHGPFMAFAEGKSIRMLIKKIYTLYLRTFVPRIYDAVIAVVDNQKEWLINEYNIPDYKIHVLPNGIDKNYIEKEIPEYSKKDKIIITYLNRIEWYKGIQTVVSAINNLVNSKYKLPPFEFWIMGRPGKFTKTIQNMVTTNNLEKYIKYKFSPSDEERDEIFLKDSQINILPSKWEATGITLIEAMAKGNAVITTTQNQAATMLVKEGVSGFTFSFGDVEGLTHILKRLLTDHNLRQSMIKHNHEFVKNFTWESVFPKYEILIKEL